jgi:hypothetical protein
MKLHVVIISAAVMLFALMVFGSILLSIPAVLAFIGGLWVGRKEHIVSSAIERGVSKTREVFRKFTSAK